MTKSVQMTFTRMRSFYALLIALALAACGVELPAVNPAAPGEISAPASTATPTQTPTATPVATHHALAEFGRPISDASILTLVRRHNAMIWRAYTDIGGFGGSSGLRGPVNLETLAGLDRTEHASVFDSAVFLRELRANRVSDFSGALSGSIGSMAQFLIADHSAQEMQDNSDARVQGVELLASNDRLLFARDRTAAGDPHVYAIEVYGSESNLRNLGSDPAVRRFNIVAIGSAPRWNWPHPPNAAAVSGSGGDYYHLDGKTLYARLEALANRRDPTPTPTPMPTPTPTPTPAPTPTPTPAPPPGPVSGQ